MKEIFLFSRFSGNKAEKGSFFTDNVSVAEETTETGLVDPAQKTSMTLPTQ